MMRELFDIITHCNDTAALMAEVGDKMPERLIVDEETGLPIGFAVNKTDTKRNGAETLSVVRVNADELALIESLSSVSILAKVAAGGDLLAALDAVPANAAIYDRVHDQTPQVVDDGNGGTITVTPGRLIGAFA